VLLLSFAESSLGGTVLCLALRSGLRGQWLPARLLRLALSALLSGLFALEIRLSVEGLALLAQFIVGRSWQVADEISRAGEVEIDVGSKVKEGAFVISETIGIHMGGVFVAARRRGALAGRILVRALASLDPGSPVLMLVVRVVGGKSGKQEVLLIWGQVKTSLVSLIVIAHCDRFKARWYGEKAVGQKMSMENQ
jgi:hypothetical protein